ncbi:hypothetical protein ABW20_dc0101851 [Dactylellina cionopaga]|nr:hypothetical protein ABW20_dc0101851 [Dactylellina cionopaga]
MALNDLIDTPLTFLDSDWDLSNPTGQPPSQAEQSHSHAITHQSDLQTPSFGNQLQYTPLLQAEQFSPNDSDHQIRRLVYTCAQCQETFTDRKKYGRHMWGEHAVYAFKCHCGVRAKRHDNLRVMKHHPHCNQKPAPPAAKSPPRLAPRMDIPVKKGRRVSYRKELPISTPPLSLSPSPPRLQGTPPSVMQDPSQASQSPSSRESRTPQDASFNTSPASPNRRNDDIITSDNPRRCIAQVQAMNNTLLRELKMAKKERDLYKDQNNLLNEAVVSSESEVQALLKEVACYREKLVSLEGANT